MAGISKNNISAIKISFALLLQIFSANTMAQNERAQIPQVLNNSYFEVNLGFIQYPFSEIQVEEGYTFHAVQIPHAALRLIPAGYQFNKYLSAQISYMRPVLWVHYQYKNGLDESVFTRAVWMNVAGLTIKPSLPINTRFSIYGEGGLSIITRKGFNDEDNTPVVTNANYTTTLFGGGVKYHLNKNWGLMLNMVYSPENKKVKQPATSFYSAGFSYTLLPFSDEHLAEAARNGYIHPKQTIQIGITSNVFGYGVNNFVSEGKVPIFWAGEAEVQSGFSINYQRNIFYGAKAFSLDWGASLGIWRSNVNKEKFYTLSIYPVLKWTFLHTDPVDVYFFYTVAGPAYISRTMVDEKDLGKHFTFQDNMGTGFFFGENRNFNVEIKIGHYSNGDLFPGNEGVKIPLTLNLGYSF